MVSVFREWYQSFASLRVRVLTQLFPPVCYQQHWYRPDKVSAGECGVIAGGSYCESHNRVCLIPSIDLLNTQINSFTHHTSVISVTDPGQMTTEQSCGMRTEQ